MSCPRCRTAMSSQTLVGHLGTTIVIDVCLSCQAFWFSQRERLQLSPSSTPTLFRLIGDQADACPETRAAEATGVPEDSQVTSQFEVRGS